MSTWTVKVVLVDCTRGGAEPRTLVTDDATSDALIVKLCEMQARFEHEGKTYYCGRPLVNPIAKTITYHAEYLG